MPAPKHLITATIENLSPSIEQGRYPVKRVPGEELTVEADIIKDGHDLLQVILKWRMEGERTWHETPMAHLDNDRWRGACSFPSVGFGEFTIEVSTEHWLSWRKEFAKKFEAELKFDFGSVIGEVEAPHPTPMSVLREFVADSTGFATAMLDVQAKIVRMA